MTVLNPLTVAIPATSRRSAALPRFTHAWLPYSLTLAPESRIPRLPKPLTFFPEPAHRPPRTPSPACPAHPHRTSRKASPDPAVSLAWYGFAMALTFLTGIKGVYFYYSQARLPSAFPEIPSSNAKDRREHTPLPARETGGKILATMKKQAFTIAYETNFDLFHGRSEQDGLRTPLERKKR
jgi:hypothetical protein